MHDQRTRWADARVEVYDHVTQLPPAWKRDLKPHQRKADGAPADVIDEKGYVLVPAEDIPSPAEVKAWKEREQRELEEYGAKVAATPWHKRSWMISERLELPVSRWGRVVYFAVLPFVLVAWLAINLLLSGPFI